MTKLVFLLVISSVALSSLAQVVLKAGMMSPLVAAASQQGLSWALARSVALNITVLAGLALYFGSAVIWLFVLAKVELSLAYPFVGLGFIFTMLLAHWVHGEVLSVTRIAGTLLIAFGVLVLATT